MLTLLNIVGVHEIAVATGFLTADTKPGRMPDLLSIGLERKTTEVTRYGIDPFEGLHPWMLFLFNLVLRLKGWLANQAVRYLVRGGATPTVPNPTNWAKAGGVGIGGL